MKIKISFLTLMLLLCFSIQGQTEKNLSRPEKNFEKFWITFKDNYAFFKLKGVDWDETYKIFRPQVNRKTKEKELIQLFSEMVAPLKDGHISISKKDQIVYKVKKPSVFKEEFKGHEKELWETSFKTLEKNGFSEIKGIGPIVNNEHLYYVSQNSDIGFVRISRCFGSLESIYDDKKEIEDTQLMLSLFDSILNSFSKTKGIIIDIRANGGGHGGLELATRLANEKKITHYKAVRIKGNYDAISTLEPIYITPNQGVNYANPVVILTNDKTASSAEDFTIALYQQKNVTTLGTNTAGMLSDMLSTDLYHKISFTLSNQIYYSIDKIPLEGIGVPAKIKLKNSKKDIENGIDPLIIKAIEILN
ncbi:S41 family peptidase [Flavobacterium sp. GP15]|uniref:S41 family peptidase n=1 Tax=Flavobacterium sp. GP15 TaxID=2758567 RepID=UPI00165D4ACC|nr:S41 family peptidase [Flavobacterium sp. GP15]